MFTGIVTHKSKVKSVSQVNNHLIIENPLSDLIRGTSISVDGACLTVSAVDDSSISFDISEETFSRTIIKNYNHGDKVNLELPVKSDTLLSGHIVLGHVDTVGAISTVNQIKDDLWNYYITVPNDEYIVDKGSVSLNGISLTTNIDSNNSFYVSVIKETYNTTNISDFNIQKKSEVNIEYDIIGKYVNKFVK